jgi:hypothetical protein
MITPAGFIAKWHGEPLVRAEMSVLQNINIPQTSKQFLCEAGLPRTIWNSVCFDRLAGNLLPLSLALEGKYGLLPELNRYRIIGETQYNQYFCVDEDGSGKVIRYLEPYPYSIWGYKPVNLINSSVAQFAESLLVHQDFEPIFDREAKIAESDSSNSQESDLAYHKAKMLLDRLLKDLRNIDPDAMNEDDYWPTYVDRILG